MPTTSLFSPVELEIELFCLGFRIAPATRTELEARRITRTRAGLGSGLEIVVPSPRKEIWVNVPVEEPFATRSPLELVARDGGWAVHDSRSGAHYAVRIPPEPAWYSEKTSSGTEMSRVGVLQAATTPIPTIPSCRTAVDTRPPARPAISPSSAPGTSPD